MQNLIELRGVSKVYNSTSHVHALKNVNIKIREGELASIIGVSGSGKSTLLNILGMLDTQTEGDYFFNSINTSAMLPSTRAALRGSSIGFIFQSFHLMPNKTVLQNVMLSGIYSKISAKVRRVNSLDAIEKVGLADRANFKVQNLSGGEKQRVAIARAIARRPKLLLCDEPTGNLDSATSDEIEKLLHQMNSSDKLTVLIVTHNTELASRTKRVIRVKDGEVVNE